MGTSQDSEKTKAKLIAAAGQLFSDKGFKGITVRDIARTAAVPLSAINYHFKTKEALYREVLLTACEFSSLSLIEQEHLSTLKPYDALFELVQGAIKADSQQQKPNWQSVIVTRECWEPSQVFEEVVEKHWKPQTLFLLNMVGAQVQKPSSDKHVRLAVICLFGLIDTFSHYGRFIEAVVPGLEQEFPKQNWLVRHITCMVLDVACGKEFLK